MITILCNSSTFEPQCLEAVDAICTVSGISFYRHTTDICGKWKLFCLRYMTHSNWVRYMWEACCSLSVWKQNTPSHAYTYERRPQNSWNSNVACVPRKSGKNIWRSDAPKIGSCTTTMHLHTLLYQPETMRWSLHIHHIRQYSLHATSFCSEMKNEIEREKIQHCGRNPGGKKQNALNIVTKDGNVIRNRRNAGTSVLHHKESILKGIKGEMLQVSLKYLFLTIPGIFWVPPSYTCTHGYTISVKASSWFN